MIVHNMDKIHTHNVKGKRPDAREQILWNSTYVQLKTGRMNSSVRNTDSEDT